MHQQSSVPPFNETSETLVAGAIATVTLTEGTDPSGGPAWFVSHLSYDIVALQPVAIQIQSRAIKARSHGKISVEIFSSPAFMPRHRSPHLEVGETGVEQSLRSCAKKARDIKSRSASGLTLLLRNCWNRSPPWRHDSRVEWGDDGWSVLPRNRSRKGALIKWDAARASFGLRPSVACSGISTGGARRSSIADFSELVLSATNELLQTTRLSSGVAGEGNSRTNALAIRASICRRSVVLRHRSQCTKGRGRMAKRRRRRTGLQKAGANVFSIVTSASEASKSSV